MGDSVRALARSARRIPVAHPKIEKMAGDALEMATVKRALTGVDVVIQSLGVSAGPEIILKPTRFFSEATRGLVAAIEEAQVKRLICETALAVRLAHRHKALPHRGDASIEQKCLEPEFRLIQVMKTLFRPVKNYYRTAHALTQARRS